MKKKFLIGLACLLFLASSVFGQSIPKEKLENGYTFISTKTYSQEENDEILKLYSKLRVADVSDGMDMVGLPNTGLVDESIHPAWVNLKTLSHVIRGIALTARYVPTQRPDRPSSNEDFSAWEGSFYGNYSSEAFVPLIQKGSVIVIDDVEDKNIGTIGSNNILGWKAKGAIGVVTDASARDIDEVGIEEIPLYLRKKGIGIRPGRNELESVNRPVSIGGVLVCPGDIVVADSDGVVVVPRSVAKEVALNAQKVLDGDKAGRKGLYIKLGMPLDNTVK